MSDRKPQVLDLLDRAFADLQTFIGTLSEADRAAVGTREHWAIKDAISHNSMWQQRAIERMTAILRDEEPPNTDEYLAINDAHFELYRERSWADTVAEAERTYRALVDLTRSLSEMDLTDPVRFAKANGRPLLRHIVSNGFEHPEMHLAQLYVERGEVEHATQLQEEATARLEELPEERGTARYNLACYYALAGQKAKALIELKTALTVNPGLMEWSKQDTDLNSLRDDPAYQALYQSA